MKIDRTHLRRIIREELEHLTENPNNPTPAVFSKEVLLDKIDDKIDFNQTTNRMLTIIADLLQNYVVTLDHWHEIQNTGGDPLSVFVRMAESLLDKVLPAGFKMSDMKERIVLYVSVLSAMSRIATDPTLRAELETTIDHYRTMMSQAKLGGLEREVDQLEEEMVEAVVMRIVTALQEDISMQPMRADQNLRKSFKMLGLD